MTQLAHALDPIGEPIDTAAHSGPVASTAIPADQYTNTLFRLFGTAAARFERMAYFWADRLSVEYRRGGFGLFYALSNGGFYMAPEHPQRLTVAVEANGYAGTLSADAFGITVTIFALNYVAHEVADERLIDLYHQLLSYAAGHPESVEIFQAIH
ncbi:antirestriction protein [Ideonella sp. DXS29W]|uniref:Antirestriction protein n=1 Tax=Ideonella lacteola TaxID=2984193 RepID=A0ABU9BW92_9BURK